MDPSHSHIDPVQHYVPPTSSAHQMLNLFRFSIQNSKQLNRLFVFLLNVRSSELFLLSSFFTLCQPFVVHNIFSEFLLQHRCVEDVLSRFTLHTFTVRHTSHYDALWSHSRTHSIEMSWMPTREPCTSIKKRWCTARGWFTFGVLFGFLVRMRGLQNNNRWVRCPRHRMHLPQLCPLWVALMFWWYLSTPTTRCVKMALTLHDHCRGMLCLVCKTWGVDRQSHPIPCSLLQSFHRRHQTPNVGLYNLWVCRRQPLFSLLSEWFRPTTSYKRQGRRET
jgi:hypothetical protein